MKLLISDIEVNAKHGVYEEYDLPIYLEEKWFGLDCCTWEDFNLADYFKVYQLDSKSWCLMTSGGQYVAVISAYCKYSDCLCSDSYLHDIRKGFLDQYLHDIYEKHLDRSYQTNPYAPNDELEWIEL